MVLSSPKVRSTVADQKARAAADLRFERHPAERDLFAVREPFKADGVQYVLSPSVAKLSALSARPSFVDSRIGETGRNTAGGWATVCIVPLRNWRRRSIASLPLHLDGDVREGAKAP